MNYEQERIDMAITLRWMDRYGFSEGLANHISVRIEDDGKENRKILLNPNERHFALVRAHEMLLLDINDESVLSSENPPDSTAWGLHSMIHKYCEHAKVVLHAHPPYGTALASLKDSSLPPIDQNTAKYFNRIVIDEGYGGLAFEEEGMRCAKLLNDPDKPIMIMGNHGILVIAETVAEAFFQFYYFERACKNYILALQTGQELRLLSDEIATKVAQESKDFPDPARPWLDQLRIILDQEGTGYI